MEQEILNRLNAQEELLKKVYVSAEKTRMYFLWTFYVTIALFVLPLVGLMFAVPALMSTLGSAYGF